MKRKATDAPFYGASVDFTADPVTIQVACEDCDWSGNADQLNEIGSCSLTPGDPSPAGRCPECDTLAYVVAPSTGELLDALAETRVCLSAWVEIADDEDKRNTDDEALAQAEKLLRAAGRLK